MSQAPEEFKVTFEEGWPDVLPIGLIVVRSTVIPTTNESSVTDQQLSWVIQVGTADVAPRLALFGDLAVRNSAAFAGASVVMPIGLRDEPDQMTPVYTDSILRRYGPWASSMLYDHTAMVLRTALSGTGYELEVPFLTPSPRLRFSTDAPPDDSDFD